MVGRFVKPSSLKEALDMLNKEKSLIISGGTDLLVKLRKSKRDIEEALIDISSLEELKEIKEKNSIITIGAACTHSDIEKNIIINKNLPILAKGCSVVGSTLIRNRGTIGGNIVNNSNCADSVPPLFILEGSIIVESIEGKRKLSLDEFFYDTNKIDLKKNEIVTAIEVKPLKGYLWDLFKVGRRKSLAISRLTLAIAVKLNNGVIEDLRIIPGAMLPNYRRLKATEEKFAGKILKDNIELIADSATKEAIKMSGRRWSTEYKEPVLRGLIIRTLENFI